MKGAGNKYVAASSVLIGTSVGAGVLGIPYVASQSGFLVTFAYIVLLGILIYTVNSFIGEVVLRTKGDHQLIGYVEKYLGLKARHVMEFALVFGAYAAMLAYMVGMGGSLSYIFLKTTKYTIPFGIFVGLFMAFFLKGGLDYLKKYEKYGLYIVMGLLTLIVGLFMPKVVVSNLMGYNHANLLLPFGVVLFSLLSFTSIPQVKLILKGNERLFRKVLMTGTLFAIIFYTLFTIVVLGYMGSSTPPVATMTLGGLFVTLGMFTMFTSYLATGNALIESFQFDERYTKKVSWFLATFVPIVLFVLTQATTFFSFTRILSIGGVVSGGLVAILGLLMVNKAKVHGDRNPEYSMKSHWYILGGIILIFVFGVVREIFF
jgi:amino acid permease